MKNNPAKNEIYKKDLEPQKTGINEEDLDLLNRKFAEFEDSLNKTKLELLKSVSSFSEQINSKVN